MKRFQVHVAVSKLDDSIRFYSRLFGEQPTVQKPDHAKWMVEDPRINFVISARGGEPGVNHLGLQVDSDAELAGMRDRLVAADAGLVAADAGLVEESGANCCYAKSDKYWVTDPQGIAWETYHSLGSIPMFGAARELPVTTGASACCTPSTAVSLAIPVKVRSGCCS